MAHFFSSHFLLPILCLSPRSLPKPHHCVIKQFSSRGREERRLWERGWSSSAYLYVKIKICYYFQVKLGRMFNIRGVATQGRHDSDQWVTSFSLAYTADDFNWVYIRENSQIKVNRKQTIVWTVWDSITHSLNNRTDWLRPSLYVAVSLILIQTNLIQGPLSN